MLHEMLIMLLQVSGGGEVPQIEERVSIGQTHTNQRTSKREHARTHSSCSNGYSTNGVNGNSSSNNMAAAGAAAGEQQQQHWQQQQLHHSLPSFIYLFHLSLSEYERQQPSHDIPPPSLHFKISIRTYMYIHLLIQ